MNSRYISVVSKFGLLLLILCAGKSVVAQTSTMPVALGPTTAMRDGSFEFATTGQVRKPEITVASLPIAFEPNRGQFVPDVRFAAHTDDALILLTDQGAEIELMEYPAGAGDQRLPQIRTLKLSIVGISSNVKLIGADELQGKVNYLVGSDRSRWITNVATYRRVQYTSDAGKFGLVFYGNDQHALEYDLIVPSGVDPRKARLRVEGADRTSIDSKGDLVITVGRREIRQRKPVAYSEGQHGRRPVAVNYMMLKPSEVGFSVASFDRRDLLVIDPTLIYSSYLAGNLADTAARGIAADPSGNAYVTGHTRSFFFPTTPSSVEPQCVASTTNSGGCSAILMAFVTKVNPTGTGIVYSTFLGGTTGPVNEGIGSLASAGSIAVGADGSAYVAGTIAPQIDFQAWPLPSSAQSQPPCQGSPSASGAGGVGFLVKLSPDGSSLQYSFLFDLASPFATYATSVTLDSSGNAYVAGFFVTFDNLGTAGTKAFIAKIDPTRCDNPASNVGGGQIWMNRFGTAGKNTKALGVVVDSSGNSYLTGSTDDPSFPVTSGPIQSNPPEPPSCTGPCTKAFVMKLGPDGSQLLSTYLATNTGQGDVGWGITVDRNSAPTITGTTTASDFPTQGSSPTQTAFQTTCRANGGICAFVSKFNATLSSLEWSTYLSGSGSAQSFAIASDFTDNIYVTGTTESSDFPVIAAVPPGDCSLPNVGFGNCGPVFVTAFSPGGAVLYSILTGGSASGTGLGIASDVQNNIYVAGQTSATDFPVFPGTNSNFPEVFSQPGNGFVFKLGLATTVTTLISSANPSVVSNPVTLTAAVTSVFDTPIGTVVFRDGVNPLGTADLVAGKASFTTSSLSIGTHTIAAIYRGSAGFAGSAASLQQVINAAPAATTTTITAAPNPAQTSQLIFLTVTITSTGPNVPMGSFQLLLENQVIATEPITPGVPTVIATAFAFAGTHSYTATYLGDAFNASSTSAPVVVTVLAPATPAIQLSNTSLDFGNLALGKSTLPAVFPTGQLPTAPAAADVNGDGILDLIVPNDFDNTVSVLLGNGDGTFKPQLTFPVGKQPNAVAVADFNRDGKLDLALANQGSANITVLFGNGDGTFQPGVNYPAAAEPFSIAAADFNGDGIPDLAVGNASGTIDIFLGSADGTFSTAVGYSVGGGEGVSAVDLTGNHILDLVTNGRVLVGVGNGNFGAVTSFESGSSSDVWVTVADFNGDGKPDLAVADRGSTSARVFLGNGDGTFGSPQIVEFHREPFSVTSGDVNGDGKPDLVLSSDINSSVSVALGNGDGTFQTPVAYGFSGVEFSILADLRNNGAPDLIASQFFAGSVAVAYNDGTGKFQAPISIRVKNTGTADLHVTSVSLTGANPADFPIAFNTCTSLPLSPGETCAINIGFRPTALGLRSATLQIVDDAAGSPQAVSLSGTGINTPAGANITVSPIDISTGVAPVSLAFTKVTQPGNTTLTTSSTGPTPPASFSLGNPPVYYDLSTAANFTGPIQICINYAGVSYSNPSQLRLFHFDNGSWMDVTTSLNPTSTTICGSVTSLSPFAVFQRIPQTPVIDWAVPAPISYGTALSSSQLNALASFGGLPVPGAFTYSPPVGTVLTAGVHTLSVTFAPSDAASFTSATSSVQITVNPAVLTVTASNSSRPFGFDNPAFTAGYSGFVNGDSFAIAVTGSPSFSTTATTSSPIGVYPILITQGSLFAANYTFSFVNGSLTITPAATKVSLSSSLRTIGVGQSVTFTAVVSPAGSGTPTGTVTFSDGTTTLGSSPLSSAQATFSTSSLAVGLHPITVTYSGDGNFSASTSSVLTESVAYNICALYDQTKSVNSGAVFPIKLQLCSFANVDLSASTIVVHATSVTSISGYSGPPESPGNANPDNDFRFDTTLGPSGGYIFNFSTSGLTTGTYSLQFTAIGDPTTHSVYFGVK